MRQVRATFADVPPYTEHSLDQIFDRYQRKEFDCAHCKKRREIAEIKWRIRQDRRKP